MDLNKPIAEQISGAQAGISDTISNATSQITSGFASPTDLGGASSEFLNSNSIISKFVFLILVLVIFIMLLNLGVYLISYFLRPNTSPYVVKGLINANRKITVTQDPKNSNAVTIYRSNNEDKGIEFTWSVWLYLDGLPADSNPIFSKGVGSSQKGPAVTFIKQSTDSTTDSTAETGTGAIKIEMDSVVPNDPDNIPVYIKNVPLNRWFNLAIRMQNKIMDVYVNGVVANRYVFKNVPKQNYGDIEVGGFNGNLSDLRYFDSALNVFQINNITMAGPNLTSAATAKDTKFDYLANAWYQPQA
jgi:hypothetical protein